MFSFFLSTAFSILTGPLAPNSYYADINPIHPHENKLRNFLPGKYLFSIKPEHLSYIQNQNIEFKVIFSTKDLIVISSASLPKDRSHIFNVFVDTPHTLRHSDVTANQFSLHNTGQDGGRPDEDINLFPAWDQGFKGLNSTLLVVDDGCYYNHSEFIERFNLNISMDVNSQTHDPSPRSSSDFHGTECLGLAGSSGYQFMSGVAPESTLACHRLDFTNATFESALTSLSSYPDSIDVSSNSWEIKTFITNTSNEETFIPYYFQTPPLLTQSLNELMKTTRHGLGRSIVFASANGAENGQDANSIIWANDRHVIDVGASNFLGSHSYYSDTGHCLFTNAPSSGGYAVVSKFDLFPFIETTAINDRYDSTFTGTSAAAPLVSGSIALITQANSNLTWRDVMMIIACTSTQNDPMHFSWHQNKANFNYSSFYGFGRIDVLLAIQTAKNWTNIPEEYSETAWDNSTYNIPTYMNDSLIIDFSIDNPEILFIESVVVSFDSDSDEIPMLAMTLLSPNGDKEITFKGITDQVEGYSHQIKFSFTVRDFLGESNVNSDDNSRSGKWQLKITSFSLDTDRNGHISNLSLEVFGMHEDYGKNLPNITRRQAGNAGEPVDFDPNDIQRNSTECGVNQTYDLFPKSPLIKGHRSAMIAELSHSHRMAGAAVNSTSDTLQFAIPCLFKDQTEFYVHVTTVESNYSANLLLTVSNPLQKDETKVRLLKPEENQVIDKNGILELEWNMGMDSGLDSGWLQMAVVRLYRVDGDKNVLLSNNPIWNNGKAYIKLDGSLECQKCLLQVTPIFYELDDEAIGNVMTTYISLTNVPETSSSESIPTEITQSESISTEITQSESISTETTQSEPIPTEITQSEPIPTETTQSEPIPTETSPSEPIPTETSPSEPIPTETTQSESIPTETPPSESSTPGKSNKSKNLVIGLSVGGGVLLIVIIVLVVIFIRRHKKTELSTSSMSTTTLNNNLLV